MSPGSPSSTKKRDSDLSNLDSKNVSGDQQKILHLNRGDSSPGGHRSSTFSGSSPSRRMQPRISFFAQESNPFVEEISNGEKTNIHKNYEDFFAKNIEIAEEAEQTGQTERGERGEGIDEVKESRNSQISSMGDFDEVLQRVQGLSAKKQVLMMEKLSQLVKAK